MLLTGIGSGETEAEMNVGREKSEPESFSLFTGFQREDRNVEHSCMEGKTRQTQRWKFKFGNLKLKTSSRLQGLLQFQQVQPVMVEGP